jgi:hypothetical protein
MMIITRVRRNGRVDLVIVLAEENIERIRRYDPAQFDYSTLPVDSSLRRPETVAVAFATAAELGEIERMSASDSDWKEKALKLLSRGFEFRPDLGDHDFGPTVLGKPTEGAKQ